jgi:hypothetical protein
VNGNKPKVKYLNAFTGRVAQFPRVAYYPLGGGKCETAVAMVIDEVLVGKAAGKYDPVRTLLNQQATDTGRTVFGGLKPAPKEDIEIWRLKTTPGNQHHPDVAMLVWEARKRLSKTTIPPERVAPNHVLIPSNYRTCPDGPPEGAEDVNRPLPARDKKKRPVDVVVIDSGYVADGPAAPRIEGLERGSGLAPPRSRALPASSDRPTAGLLNRRSRST